MKLFEHLVRGFSARSIFYDYALLVQKWRRACVCKGCVPACAGHVMTCLIDTRI